jgi:scyllo-inositol 2-dehydrogenase (NADP+)
MNLAKIRETKAPNIEIASQRYPSAEIVSDSDEIFKDPNIDLVVLATPNKAHFPLAEQALEHKKHVVIDKPFTITTAEADELIALAATNNLKLSVFHNRRWDSDFRTLEKIITNGTLGDIAEIEIHFDRFRPNLKGNNAWREENIPGSGVLYDLGSHLIDQALVLFGRPKSIQADVRCQRPQSIVDDYFEIDLFYDGLKVILKAGVLVKEIGPHFIVHGNQGSFIKYGMDVQEDHLKAGDLPNADPHWGEEPESLQGKLNIDDNGQSVISRVTSEPGDYRIYYQNVYEAIANDAPLKVTPKQARQVIELLELANMSAHQERRIKL